MKKGLLPFAVEVGTVVGVSALVFFMFAPLAFASHPSAPKELHGYAWSSTIGWIGFNCADSASCATSDFKVVKQLDGTLTGYAWSSSIGWITFTPAVRAGEQYPKDPFTPTVSDHSARFEGDTVIGWVRACSVFTAGPDGKQECGAGDDTLRPDSERGGFDGWIKLSGKAEDGGTYTVTLGSPRPDGTRSFSGFSWGADIIGWVNWNGVYLTEPPPDLTAETPTISGLTSTRNPDNPNEYYPGRATLSGIVRNTGSGNALSTFTNQYRFRFSSDGAFYPFTDSTREDHPPLSFPLTETALVPHNTARPVSPHEFVAGIGEWELQLCADYPLPGAVTETNETNNCSATPLTITIVPPIPPPPTTPPTVVVPSCAAGDLPAAMISAAQAGGKLEVSWAPVSGATSYRLYRKAADSAVALVVDANPSQEGPQDFTAAPRSAAPFVDSGLSHGVSYSYYLEAEIEGTFRGASPSSKGAEPSVECPDLIIEPGSIQVINAADSSVYDPANVPVNTPVRFRAVVRNQGGGTEVRFNNQFVLDGDTLRFNPSKLEGLGLDANARETVSSIFRTGNSWTSTLGPHTLEVCADRPPAGKGLVQNETSEDNNCLPLPFTVVQPLTATLECYDSATGKYRTDYCIVDYGAKPTLRWNTTGASACTGRGDWSENKPLLGGGDIENVTLPSKGKSGNPFEYSFELECER